MFFFCVYIYKCGYMTFDQHSSPSTSPASSPSSFIIVFSCVLSSRLFPPACFRATLSSSFEALLGAGYSQFLFSREIVSFQSLALPGYGTSSQRSLLICTVWWSSSTISAICRQASLLLSCTMMLHAAGSGASLKFGQGGFQWTQTASWATAWWTSMACSCHPWQVGLAVKFALRELIQRTLQTVATAAGHVAALHALLAQAKPRLPPHIVRHAGQAPLLLQRVASRAHPARKGLTKMQLVRQPVWDAAMTPQLCFAGRLRKEIVFARLLWFEPRVSACHVSPVCLAPAEAR